MNSLREKVPVQRGLVWIVEFCPTKFIYRAVCVLAVSSLKYYEALQGHATREESANNAAALA